MAENRPGVATGARRLLARIGARGPIEVAALAASRAAENLWSSDVLLMYVASATGVEAPRSDLRLVEATPADGDRYARTIGTESPRTFSDRLTPSTRCWLVEAGDRLVHSSWTTTAAAWTREIRGRITPEEGDAYIYESFTIPAMRGRGVYPFALTNVVARLGRRGKKRVWVGVESHNRSSIRAVEKAGFEKAFEIGFARRFGVLRIGAPAGPGVEHARKLLRAL